jgi:hypothetical protein
MTRPAPTTREATAALAKYHAAMDAYHERKRQERLPQGTVVIAFPGRFVRRGLES